MCAMSTSRTILFRSEENAMKSYRQFGRAVDMCNVRVSFRNEFKFHFPKFRRVTHGHSRHEHRRTPTDHAPIKLIVLFSLGISPWRRRRRLRVWVCVSQHDRTRSHLLLEFLFVAVWR